MIYIFDIDNTILKTEDGDYPNAEPIPGRIERVNQLYDEGHTIVYWTARGSVSGINWKYFTAVQLAKFGCKYHELHVKKPHYHVWVDDKAQNSEVFFSNH